MRLEAIEMGSDMVEVFHAKRKFAIELLEALAAVSGTSESACVQLDKVTEILDELCGFHEIDISGICA